MLFAGFNVASGRYSLLAITVVGTVANVVGSWAAYGLGYYGRTDLIERHGRKLLISPKHLRRADDWFERYGGATVFFTRMLPIVRTFISLPAGVARMPFWKFTFLTTAGCFPWVLMLGFIGVQAGASWTRWRDSLHYVDYAVAGLILLGLAFLGVRFAARRWRRTTQEAEVTEESASEAAPGSVETQEASA